jgi:hypothetical protein
MLFVVSLAEKAYFPLLSNNAIVDQALECLIGNTLFCVRKIHFIHVFGRRLLLCYKQPTIPTVPDIQFATSTSSIPHITHISL